MILTIAVTMLVLGVLIFVHELGHFMAAKSVDIEVSRFSIGLGPKVFGVHRGETEYVFSWIPLGGYVKMVGMADEEVTSKLEGRTDTPSKSPSGRDFDAKPIWARAFVLSAGVFMNWLFALIAFTALAMGQGVNEPRIQSVTEGSPAEQAGLRAGDLIRRVDGMSVRNPAQVIIGVERKVGEPIDIVVDRDGKKLEFVATPEGIEQFNELLGESGTVGRVGIVIGQYSSRAGPIEAIAQGWGNAAYWTTAVAQFLGDLVTGKSSAREVGGPIMIGQISGAAARAGFWPLLGFMAFISINLAVFNLLPIPVLDGGHLMFLGVEAVRGKALSIKQRLRFTTVGMGVVVAVMLWAVGNDLLRVFFR